MAQIGLREEPREDAWIEGMDRDGGSLYRKRQFKFGLGTSVEVDVAACVVYGRGQVACVSSVNHVYSAEL